jgi:hypothetical protein
MGWMLTAGTPQHATYFQVSPGRVLRTTPVFDSYWRFATLRQELFLKRVMGAPPLRGRAVLP